MCTIALKNRVVPLGTLPLSIRQPPFSIPEKAGASEEAPRPTVETIGVACLCQRAMRDAVDR
jgi:hypothetical protein